MIQTFVESTNGRIPIIAGITLEGTAVAAEEFAEAFDALKAHLEPLKNLNKK